MKRIFSAALLLAFALFSMPAPAYAQAQVGGQGFACSGPVACSQTIGDTFFYSAVTTTLTQAIAAPTNAAQSIHITQLNFYGLESATGGNIQLEYGTGTNCGTGTTVLAKIAWLVSTVYTAGTVGAIKVPAGQALCVNADAGTVTIASVFGMYSTW